MREAKASTPTLTESCHYFFKNPKVPFTDVLITLHATGGAAFASGDKLLVAMIDADGNATPLTAEIDLDSSEKLSYTFSHQCVAVLVTLKLNTGSIEAKIKCSFYTKPGSSDYVRTRSGYIEGPAPATGTFAMDADGYGGRGDLNPNATTTGGWNKWAFGFYGSHNYKSNSVTCVSEW